MRFDLITIFPDFFTGPLDFGIVRRAREAHLIETHVHDLRAFTHDRHRTVDDRPFGGGEGMVMKPEPLFDAVESLLGATPASAATNIETTAAAAAAGANASAPPGTAIVLLSAAGKLFRQQTACRLAKFQRIVLLCGRYEGVDERVAEHLATDELSIGDFVLSGGELAAAMILDAVTRLLPGALGNEDSAVNESFSEDSSPAETEAAAASETAAALAATTATGIVAPQQAAPLADPSAAAVETPPRSLLDFPHYTRPASFRGWDVPAILLNGNHEEIRRWRRAKALEKTQRNRPDLFRSASLTAEDRKLLVNIGSKSV